MSSKKSCKNHSAGKLICTIVVLFSIVDCCMEIFLRTRRRRLTSSYRNMRILPQMSLMSSTGLFPVTSGTTYGK